MTQQKSKKDQMLKFYGSAVTFSEFPDEIALCVNISNCPCKCKGCSETFLREDIGVYLTNEKIQELVDANPGCTVFGLLGGDINHSDIIRISEYIHKNTNLKLGFYSGEDYLDINLIPYVDFYKIGRWIMPKGDPATWHTSSCGPISFPFSNQKYFEKKENKLIDCSNKFRRQPINDYSYYIIKN